MCSPPSLYLLYPVSRCSSARDDALRTIVSFAVCLLLSSWELWVPPLIYQASSLRQKASTVPKVLATQWQSVGRRMTLCQTVSFSRSGGSQWPCRGTLLVCKQESDETKVRSGCKLKIIDFFKNYQLLLNQVVMPIGPHMLWTLNKSTMSFCVAIIIT